MTRVFKCDMSADCYAVDHYKAEAERGEERFKHLCEMANKKVADLVESLSAMTALAEKYQKERDELIIIIQRMIIHIHNSVIMKDLIFDANAVIKRIKEGRTDNDAIA